MDDDDNLRKALQKAFEDFSDYETLFAEDGEEAFQLLKTAGANLVVTDLQMPRMDGERLIQEVSKYNPSIPVIVMT